jgi:hypothetical protein
VFYKTRYEGHAAEDDLEATHFSPIHSIVRTSEEDARLAAVNAGPRSFLSGQIFKGYKQSRGGRFKVTINILFYVNNSRTFAFT